MPWFSFNPKKLTFEGVQAHALHIIITTLKQKTANAVELAELIDQLILYKGYTYSFYSISP